MSFARKVLYSESSPYGSYKVVDMVYDGRPARVLYGDGRSPQSGVAKDDNPGLLFDYNQRFLEILMSKQPKRVLIIGGGAFMLPTAAFHRFSRMRIDVVEIDPLLVTIARDYFDLPASKRLQVHVDDGAHFLMETKQRYDAIILDAFSGYTIPGQLIDDAAIALYRKHLTRGGIVAMNFISEYKPTRRRLAHTLLDDFGASFKNVSLYQADPHYWHGEEQNYVLVAANKPVSFDYLQSTQVDPY